MSRWFWLVFLVGCAENPCIPLAEQACIMAKEKAARPGGQPEGAQKACEAALASAKAADEAMQARCAADVSTYRKTTSPKTPGTQGAQ